MKYRTIVCDPPWPMGAPHGGRTHSDKWGDKWIGVKTVLPYGQMSLDAIKALPVASLAEDDAHLYLWTVNKFLEHVWDVARCWGFTPSTLLTWGKAPMGLGLGGAFTITTEHVLFCRRGSLAPLRRMDSTWWQWPRGEHSAKPEHFLDLVEQVSPGPYVELFARRHRLGWSTWGNQCFDTAGFEEVLSERASSVQ